VNLYWCICGKGKKEKDNMLIILNVTPVVRNDWEIYVHGKGKWAEVFNSDSKEFWGTGDVYNPEVRVNWLINLLNVIK
jgi:1,4-alpha-glucan branching enzyme